jgi:hypothetical protein
MIGAVAEVDIRRVAAQIIGNEVIEERIRRRDWILVAAQELNSLGRTATLPDADETP